MNIKRREFINYTLGSLALTSIPYKIFSFDKLPNFSQKKLKRLSFNAYNTTDIEGTWRLTEIEGKIPEEIQGRFIKIGPGTKENFGTKLNHFFDGDAYLSCFDISSDKITLTARFLNSPHRSEELINQKMLYNEFGTQSPEKKNKGRKNQPNINFIPFHDSLLALSEGGHPLEIDSKTFEAKGIYNFNNSLPKNVSFTAHPKFDSLKGEWYSFGITQGLSKALNIFKTNTQSGKLDELYSINQKNVYMIHDMTMTENYLIFVIPPAYFKITDIILGKKPMSETLEFDSKAKTTVLILPKNPNDSRFEKLELSLPPCLVFHLGNAFEENGKIKFQTFLSEDDSLLKLINEWHLDNVRPAKLPSLFNLTIDLKNKKIEAISKIIANYDFPIFNPLINMKKNQYIYAAQMENKNDPMAFSGLSKIDLVNGNILTLPMKKNEVCGEPFFIPSVTLPNQCEDCGYIAYQGYNQDRNESFLEIRDALDFNFVAKIWAGRYLPLGFHGHYLSH